MEQKSIFESQIRTLLKRDVAYFEENRCKLGNGGRAMSNQTLEHKLEVQKYMSKHRHGVKDLTADGKTAWVRHFTDVHLKEFVPVDMANKVNDRFGSKGGLIVEQLTENTRFSPSTTRSSA